MAWGQAVPTSSAAVAVNLRSYCIVFAFTPEAGDKWTEVATVSGAFTAETKDAEIEGAIELIQTGFDNAEIITIIVAPEGKTFLDGPAAIRAVIH